MKSMFPWGQVVNIHQVGGIRIIEYHPWKRDNCTIRTGTPDTDAPTEFHGTVDGNDTHEIWMSLDAALAGCIAYRHTGGTMAGAFFIRMLRPD